MSYAGERGRLLVPLLAFLLAASAFARAEMPVRASLSAGSAAIKPGEACALDLVLDIEPGWHVYGPSPGDTGLPTTVTWELPPGFSVLPIEWPAPARFSALGIDSEGYAGRLALRVRILAPKSIALRGAVSIKAKVEWLVCRVECMPGSASLEIRLPVAAATDLGGLALALLLAFAGGLILNLMPCVLPVLSIKALALTRRSPEGGRPVFQGLSFTAGVLVSFWILAGLLLALRAGGTAVGWGFQLQNQAFVAVAAIAFFLIGLNLFGVFDIGLSLSRLGGAGSGHAGRGTDRRRRGAVASSFLGGLLATAVATPCTAPFMGAALGYALLQDAYAGPTAGAAASLGVFTALGLGLAAPLLCISALPGLARRLPKAGVWTAVLRQALGFPMMASVVWMAFVLSGLGGPAALVSLLEGLLTAAIGAWAWGRWGRPDMPAGVRILAAVLALALVSGALAWSMRAVVPSMEGARAGGQSSAASTGLRRLEPADAFWQPWSEAASADLRGKGVPVFVDFTAAWCLSCQVNDSVALGGRKVRERFSELGVRALKADWTSKDDGISRALADLGRASVPLYVLYVPGKAEPLILPEILNQAIVLRYLDENIAGRR